MERIDLAQVRHADRQRWRSGDEWDERAAKIAVGVLADGRWYVRIYARNAQKCVGPIDWPGERIACAYPGEHAEHLARGTARRWMRTVGGNWVEA